MSSRTPEGRLSDAPGPGPGGARMPAVAAADVTVVAAFRRRRSRDLYARVRILAAHATVVPLEDIRSWLGLGDGRLERWYDLKRFALDPALADINALTPIALGALPLTSGRKVTAVCISWSLKTVQARSSAEREVWRYSAARRGERGGRSPAPAPLLDGGHSSLRRGAGIH